MKRFANWIRAHGSRGQCEINPSHGARRNVAPASDLAVEVDSFFRAHYVQGGYDITVDDDDRTHHEQRGEGFKEILLEELGCDDDVLSSIVDQLPDVDWHDKSQGAETFYDDSINFESLAEIRRRDEADEAEYWYERRFQFQWEDFSEQVQYRQRFFDIKKPLDQLFGKPSEYDDGAVRPVYSLPVGQRLYRARLLGRDLTEEKLRSNAAAELGAPPREKAAAGRMNVEFIPAFYAAFSLETAVAEIRPGIGEEVAIGEFEVRTELKVFDFTAFARKRDEHWEQMIRHTRYDFIKQMEDMISKPVLPSDRQREYIPTQIVGEYLKRYFNCDAVIYKSAMMKDAEIDTRNIVIWNKGRLFVGEGAPLAYVGHEIKEVANVTYRLSGFPF
ncbi:hypothetical protein HNR47_000939 [Methylopila jiangsuensis]|uniref:RES family NAD+ phosphorylase n=1 Tax=Methylopila jiangsuensis TaxID=586230 RepID=UPI0022F2DD7E|nr:RES family NAD+ phosphorylase [Methylopila jiangsuensis]MDR6284956.1 hypothetical protein [Methylopila jiangsuensis]